MQAQSGIAKTIQTPHNKHFIKPNISLKVKVFIFKVLFTTAILLAAGFTLQAQNLDQKISIASASMPLSEILSEISQQTGLHFSYNPQSIPVNQKINISFENKTARFVLDEILPPLNIRYFETENQIILKINKTLPDEGKSNQEKTTYYTISGYVRDSLSGEVMIGANIYDKISGKGTSTNGYGFFSITLAQGKYQMYFSLLGYQTKAININLNQDKTVQVNLHESHIRMREVEITAPEEDIQHLKTGASGNFNITSLMLKQMPGFAGNIDVVKSIQAIPGFNAFGDGSSFYYVRGGNSDQNLLLIDEAPIFNPAHLFGFFSALAPDAIKDIKAYKGDFPASFGGRLSSVVDVRAKDGNFNRLGFSGNLGVYTSDLTVEGPILKEKSSFILSARKSNMNWLNNRSLNSNSFSINFYDFNFKINIKINSKNRLFITAFRGNDIFSRVTNGSLHTFGINWDNTTATIRWNHLYSNKLFSNTTAIFSQYNYYLFVSREQDDYWHSSINNKTLKTDLTYYINPANTFKTGIELNTHHSNPGNLNVSGDKQQRYKAEMALYNSLGLNMYMSLNQNIGSRLSFAYGMRISSWFNFGPTSVFFFDPNHIVYDTLQVASGRYYSPYLNFEPRFNMNLLTGKNSSLRAGYSRTAQYLQMLSNSTSPFTSLEVWAPAGPNIKPQHANQFTLGYLKTLNKNGLYLTLETFYKIFYNQIDYKDHANMLFNPLIEGELRFGKARSYGLEFLLRKNKGKLNGWVGYTYTRAYKTIEGINNSKEFAAGYDRPHNLFVSISFPVGQHWDLSANWIYMTGSAITTPIAFIDYNGYQVPVYGKKNNDRLPDYHRMDIAISYKISKPESRFKQSIVLSVYNLYGRSNPFSANFNKIMDDNGNFYVPSDINGNYEIIPTTISVAGAIPSINYTFRF